jgi:hypothetical protein
MPIPLNVAAALARKGNNQMKLWCEAGIDSTRQARMAPNNQALVRRAKRVQCGGGLHLSHLDCRWRLILFVARDWSYSRGWTPIEQTSWPGAAPEMVVNARQR